jgi:hypothetical protein
MLTRFTFHLPNMKFPKVLIFISLALVPAISVAEPQVTTAETKNFFSWVESKPINELWLNPGFYSYHFNKNKGLENNNYGVGGDYRFSTVSALAIGVLHNSDKRISHYIGWYWQPVGVGPFRLGVVAGALNGYPNMLNGGWFIALIPSASVEYKNVGVNMLFTPGYKDRLYGAISLQLKLRVF